MILVTIYISYSHADIIILFIDLNVVVFDLFDVLNLFMIGWVFFELFFVKGL